ncbi:MULTISPECIES: dihydroorotate dehydrogenase [unclassified Salinibacterium]|uniref:dihydroorotate dehydrogenase n=1 Tax=unclassified Salinibacterium TaxID=2632331 RepID=UPI00143D149F|nr:MULTISPECIES: dihydroorotate dehydrogenase [unclassified Salinibacterium]
MTTAPASRRDFIAARPQTAVDLGVSIGSLRLRNPVMPASGCFGPELGRLIPSSEIGAAVTKTVFHDSRGGNPVHRLTEIEAGMVNSVGIPSRGPQGYLEELHPQYAALDTPTIISVGGHRVHEYAPLVEALGDAGDAFELNVSCPNLDREGTDIGADPEAVRQVVSAVRQVTARPLIVKLPAMVASIAESALAAQAGGADAVAVSNSVPSLPLLRRGGRRVPALGNVVGGLSGPAIRPIVTRLVWQSARAVEIPVIACGGIETADDALDYISVGATAVQIGTANFGTPFAMVAIARELQERCARAGASDLHMLLELEEGP